MKKPDYETCTKDELVAYTKWQDSILDGPTYLQKILAYTCQIIGEDLELALTGASEGFKFLSGNKDDKIFERFTTIVKLRGDLSQLSILPKEEPIVSKSIKSKLTVPAGGNVYEHALNQVKNNGSSGN